MELHLKKTKVTSGNKTKFADDINHNIYLTETEVAAEGYPNVLHVILKKES
jgi:hypothetical protein